MKKNWDTLIQIREEKVKTAEQTYRRGKHAVDATIESLDQIKQYIARYAEEISLVQSDATSMPTLRRYQEFLFQLRSVELQQSQRVEALTIEMKEGKDRLRKFQVDLKAIERIKERNDEENQANLNRRELLEHDEIARQVYLKK